MIALAWVSENMLSAGTFSVVKVFTGSIYQGGAGVFMIIGFLLSLFWVIDMIVLELKGRSLHDRITRTYVLTCANGASEEDRRAFIEENY